ncbi:MAG TPA: DEAD/DEAH box helicase [Vicinamibacterales bacterium]|nr:DEAD/DEAH box helicase [Vicinamibacterales bacterium]
MVFRGLFVGVDKYASNEISNLSCSARDARALYALFADTLAPDHCVLLLDHDATKVKVLSELTALQNADANDLVFIHFSGHGSDTHHLIAHDADPLALDASTIHLEELVTYFATIPARNVILCLDCCFAGGAGAKVFHSPVALRGAASAEALLQRIGGAGRVILTAAGADQAAMEDRRKGHGLFSFYLLTGLRGTPEVIDAGAIPFLGLAQFVTTAVQKAALEFRHVQEPALRGTLDGDVRLPPLSPGAIFRGFFPDPSSAPVTDALSSLEPHGFPAPVIAALQQSIPGLNRLQLDAINHKGLFSGDHLVVSAPTSSGKTMIGELAALRAHFRGERSFVLLPLRALVNDKYDDLTRKYAPVGMRVVRSTGEISDDDSALLRGKFDVAILTYERFASLAVTAFFLLRNVGLIVVDEVQMITDEGRGANLEFLLTFLRSQRTLGVEPQLVALSAVIGDTNGFDRWLGANLLVSTERPVPLEEGVLNLRGDFHYIDTSKAEQSVRGYVSPEYRKGSSQDVIIPLTRQLAKAGEKVIVFRDTKPVVRATAQYLAQSLGLPAARDVLTALPAGDPSAASAVLRQCLEGGVAFHNADLDREEREAIELSFRNPDGGVRVLVATTTLAMGVNTPAWSVVIEGLMHPGQTPYSVAEYKNMVGRAGRLGWTPKGKSFLIAPTSGDEYHLWSTYVRGNPESLQSRFAQQDLLTAVCRVLGTATAAKAPGLSESEIVAFLQSTFAAFQTGRIWSEADIRRAVQRLTASGLAETHEGRLRLTPLGEVAGQLGVAVESVVRVAAALRGVSVASLRAETLLAAAQVTVELDEVYLPIHKKSTQERNRWQAVPEQQNLPRSLTRALWDAEPAAITARCKRLAAVLLWVQGVELERLEASLLQHLPSENASGPIRSVAERTRDLIGVVGRIAEILNPPDPGGVDRTSSLVDSLNVQLELGVPTAMVWLAKRTKRALSRGDYLALFRARLTDAATINNATAQQLELSIPDSTRRDLVKSAARLVSIKVERTGELPMPAAPES